MTVGGRLHWSSNLETSRGLEEFSFIKSCPCSEGLFGEATALSICVSISSPNKLSGSLSLKKKKKKREVVQFVAVDVYSTKFIWGTDREAESLCLKQGQAITLGKPCKPWVPKVPYIFPK